MSPSSSDHGTVPIMVPARVMHQVERVRGQKSRVDFVVEAVEKELKRIAAMKALEEAQGAFDLAEGQSAQSFVEILRGFVPDEQAAAEGQM